MAMGQGWAERKVPCAWWHDGPSDDLILMWALGAALAWVQGMGQLPYLQLCTELSRRAQRRSAMC